jgi:uncharacterized membrane protein
MENMIDKIRPELLIVSVVLYFIGMGLKKSKLKDNFIPIILGLIGIVVGVVYCGFVEGWTFASCLTGLVQGVLCAGCSTYVNQIIKQLLKLNNVDEETADKIADKIADEITDHLDKEDK